VYRPRDHFAILDLEFPNMLKAVAEMADLTPQQKRLMWVYRLLFAAAFSSCVLLGCLTFYFGEECPRVADDSSGHVNPFYDKIHSKYVYLTDLENGSLHVLVSAGVACLFCAVLIDLKLKRSVSQTHRENGNDDIGPDHNLDK
jgi:hypothetical protein